MTPQQKWALANRPKMNAIQRRWRAANQERVNSYRRKNRAAKRDFLRDIKLQRGCADCGYSQNAAALQFDHVKGRKLFDISQHNGHGWSKVLKEIEKCDVRCANCHAIKT